MLIGSYSWYFLYLAMPRQAHRMRMAASPIPVRLIPAMQTYCLTFSFQAFSFTSQPWTLIVMIVIFA